MPYYPISLMRESMSIILISTITAVIVIISHMAVPYEVFIIGVKTFTAVMFGGGTVALVIYGFAEQGEKEARFGRVALNSNHETKKHSTRLVDQAKKKIEMFDDGDNHPESVYNDPKFVETIKKKLAAGIEVKCFFNQYDISNLLFVQELEGHQNVQIWRRPDGSERPKTPHYKIIDGGAMGRIAWHALGSQRRRFQPIDFRQARALERFCLNLRYFTPIRQRRWPHFQKFEVRAENG